MRIGVARQLIDDEQAQRDDGRGIGPAPAAEQRGHHADLHQPVKKQIDADKSMGANIHILQRKLNKPFQLVTRVGHQLVVQQEMRKLAQGVRSGEIHRNTAGTLANGKKRLEQNADEKNRMLWFGGHAGAMPRFFRKVTPMDLTITQLINGLSGHNTTFDAVIIAVTRYGVPLMVVLVALQWWQGEPRPKARHVCIAAGASFLLGLGLAQLLLLFIHRARPYDVGISHLIIDKTVDWSFPSDHAIASTSIVFAWLMNGMRRWLWLFVTMAAVICFSRVYVGMHYATDILGGIVVALLAAAVVKLIYKPGTSFDRWLTSWL